MGNLQKMEDKTDWCTVYSKILWFWNWLVHNSLFFRRTSCGAIQRIRVAWAYMHGCNYDLKYALFWKHAYPLLFWQFLVHDKPKIKCFAIFSLVKITKEDIARYVCHRIVRFSTPRDSHVILFNQSQKVNRPSETKRRFACDSAVAVVKVVFAAK